MRRMGLLWALGFESASCSMDKAILAPLSAKIRVELDTHDKLYCLSLWGEGSEYDWLKPVLQTWPVTTN